MLVRIYAVAAAHEERLFQSIGEVFAERHEHRFHQFVEGVGARRGRLAGTLALP